MLDFDELKSNPNVLLQKVYSFLNISEVFRQESYDRANVTTLKGDLELYLRKHFSKWFKYIPEGLKVKTRESIVKHAKPIPLDLTGTALKDVRDALMEDMHAFEKDYGFDVSKWGF